MTNVVFLPTPPAAGAPADERQAWANYQATIRAFREDMNGSTGQALVASYSGLVHAFGCEDQRELVARFADRVMREMKEHAA